MSETTRRRGRPATFDRDQALDAAVPLFWRHGYDGASISMLTEAMGVTAPTLYAAFGSKEALYRDALARYRAREAQAFAPIFAQSATLYEKVAAFLKASALAFSTSPEGRGCMVSIGALQCGPDAEAATGATAAARAEALQRFVAAFKDAKAKGEIPADADCETLARYYTAIVQGMAVQARDGAGKDQLDRLVEVALASWPGKTP